MTVFEPLVLDSSIGPLEFAEAILRFLRFSSQLAPVNSKVCDKSSRRAFSFLPWIVTGRDGALMVVLRSTEPGFRPSVFPLSP